MSEDLRRLLKVGFIDSIQSFSPVLIWILLGVMFRDTQYANGYIIAYPYQYIGSILYYLLFKSQLKSEVKNCATNHNRSYTGLKLLLLVYTIITCMSIKFSGVILTVMNLDASNKYIFSFGVSSILMDWVLFGVVTVLEYDDKNVKAFTTTLFWYLSKVVCILMLGHLESHEAVLMFITIYMFILLNVIVLKSCKTTEPSFYISDSIKYSLCYIPTDIGMIIIYVFGISDMSSNSIAVLSAYNLMSMCTDVQWDILRSALDTIGTLKTKAGKFISERKRLFTDAVLYSFVVFLSSCLMIIICYFIPAYRNTINFTMVWIMFILECFGFPYYAIKYSALAWISVEHPNLYVFAIQAITYTARFITMYITPGAYNVSFSVVIACIVGNTLSMILYSTYMRKELKCNT